MERTIQPFAGLGCLIGVVMQPQQLHRTIYLVIGIVVAIILVAARLSEAVL